MGLQASIVIIEGNASPRRRRLEANVHLEVPLRHPMVTHNQHCGTQTMIDEQPENPSSSVIPHVWKYAQLKRKAFDTFTTPISLNFHIFGSFEKDSENLYFDVKRTGIGT